MSAYSDLIAWDRRRRQSPVVFGFDAVDTGAKSVEDGAYTDGPAMTLTASGNPLDDTNNPACTTRYLSDCTRQHWHHR